jgi:hypothetical protein
MPPTLICGIVHLPEASTYWWNKRRSSICSIKQTQSYVTAVGLKSLGLRSLQTSVYIAAWTASRAGLARAGIAWKKMMNTEIIFLPCLNQGKRYNLD